MSINSPLRGNKYMLLIMLWQIAISFVIPLIERFTGYRLFTSQLSIIPLHIILFILPFAAYLIATSQKLSRVLPFGKLNLTNIGLIVLMCVTLQPLMMVLSGLMALIFPNNVSTAMSELYSMPLLVTLFATAITPAITEEITLRGVLLTNYQNIGIKKAALINGLIFGMLHLDPQQFLYAFLLGFLFAYFVYYTKSIFASILAHFTINFIQTVLAYASLNMIEQPELAAELEQTGFADLLSAVVALSVIALIFTPVFIVIYRAFVSYNRHRLVNNAFTETNDFDFEYETPDEPLSLKQTKVFNWPLTAMVVIFVGFVILMALAV